MLRRVVFRVLGVAFVVVILALVVGHLLGQPILLSFVTTGSMEPTIGAGDGFIAIPSQVSDINEGDVVVFEARELEGGGLTTHRIVGETDEGYITQGDANPFTDQDSDEPPVTDEQIRATALEINGNVVTIPSLGTAILWFRDGALTIQQTIGGLIGLDEPDDIQGTGVIFVLVGIVLLVATFLDSLRTQSTRKRVRSRARESVDPRLMLVFLLLVVLVPANAAMLGSGTTHEMVVDGDDLTGEVEPGDPIENELTATNSGIVTMLVTVDEPTGEATVRDRTLSVAGGASESTSIFVDAPESGTERAVTVTEQRYILLLPESVLVDLHERSPWLAIGAINGLLGFGIIAFAGGLLGFSRRSYRETSRDIPLRTRLKRWLR